MVNYGLNLASILGLVYWIIGLIYPIMAIILIIKLQDRRVLCS